MIIPDTSSTPPITFALVAGEASGDLLGAGLIGSLRQRFPQARFIGIGGPQMIAAGLDAWYPAEKLSVMGLVEVIRHLPELLRIRRDVYKRVRAASPNCFIGIDAPDFNLPLERKLKATGIRTVHYVSPSVWAWREGRAKKIGRSADRVLCLFPMEPPIYARHGVDARFVGHPLADDFPLEPERDNARAALSIPQSAHILALLPGSRLGEISRLGSIFLAAAVRLRRLHPGLQIISPMANTRCRAAFEALLSAPPGPEVDSDDNPPTQEEWQALRSVLTVLDGNAHRAMIAADLLLLASGTAALEAMLAKRPMVVSYRLSAMTAFIVRSLGLLKIKRYSLPNILAGEDLVPELMQEECTPSKIATALETWISDTKNTANIIARFGEIHRDLRRNASQSAAESIAELIARK